MTTTVNDNIGSAPASAIAPLPWGINVKDSQYGGGAKGDGATDDTAAIQAAFAAGKVSGGKIVFPAGTYLVSTLDLSQFDGSFNKQLIIEGAGRDATIIKHTGSQICIYMGGSNWITCRDFSLNSNVNSKVGFFLCRLLTPNLPNCQNNHFVNVGTVIGSTWAKAAFVGIEAEETVLERCYFDNEGGSFGTVFFSEINTNISVTMPGTDVIHTGATALSNHIDDCHIVTANALAACVTVESGAQVLIDGGTFLGQVGAVANAVGVRIIGASTDTSFAPVILSGCLVEMNGGAVVELKSTGLTNIITGLVIRDSFLSQSAQILQYSGTVEVDGFIYDGNVELRNPTALTLTGTFVAPRICMTGTNSSVVLSNGVSVYSPSILAKTITDSGAIYFGHADIRTFTGGGTTAANVTSSEWQSLLVTIVNTAGTLQHKMTSDIGSSLASLFADRIVGASATLANTPSTTPAVDFVNGMGIRASATNQLIFNTAAQTDGQQLFGVCAVEGNNTGTSFPMIGMSLASINVNGVTRSRLVLTATDTAGAAVGFTTANIGAGKLIQIRIFVRLQ